MVKELRYFIFLSKHPLFTQFLKSMQLEAGKTATKMIQNGSIFPTGYLKASQYFNGVFQWLKYFYTPFYKPTTYFYKQTAHFHIFLGACFAPMQQIRSGKNSYKMIQKWLDISHRVFKSLPNALMGYSNG